jgi:methylamine dehydrogenase heavy chain
LFVNMHPNAKNGTHKDIAKEVWAIDLGTKKLLSRSPIDNSISLAVTHGKAPVLFSVDSEAITLTRYEVNLADNFKIKFGRLFEAKLGYTQLVWVDN